SNMLCLPYLAQDFPEPLASSPESRVQDRCAGQLVRTRNPRLRCACPVTCRFHRWRSSLCLEGIKASTQISRNARPSTLKTVTSNAAYRKKKPSAARGQPLTRSTE